MLTLALIIFLTRKINLTKIINGFAIIGLFLCSAIILQQLMLITFHGGSISGFDIFISGQTDFLFMRGTVGYAAPYGLGLIENHGYPLFKLGDLSFYRPSLFTHEPKHASSVLLLTLSTVLISEFKPNKKKLFIIAHLIALMIVFSVTSFATVLFSFLIFKIFKKNILPNYFVLIVFFFPVIAPLFVEFFLRFYTQLEGVIYARVLGFFTSTVGTGIESMPSLFGRGAYGGVQNDSDTMLYYIYGQYGLVALVLIILLFYFLIKYINEHRIFIFNSLWDRFAVILLVNLFIFYNMYIFSDFLSTFSLFIFFFLFHILEKSKKLFLIRSMITV